MKNPWLSLWLSAANTWAGAARGLWTAEVQRSTKALAGQMTGAARGQTPSRKKASKKPTAKKRSSARRSGS